MDVTPTKVVENIDAGRWVVGPVRPKDKAIYRSETYNTFNVIYDENHRIVRHYYVCGKCSLMYNTELKNGTHKLRRHTCFREYLEEKKIEEEKEKERQNEEESESASKVGDNSGNTSALFLNQVLKNQQLTNNNDRLEREDDDDDVRQGELESMDVMDSESDNESEDGDESIVADELGILNDSEHTLLSIHLCKFGDLVESLGTFSRDDIKDNMPNVFTIDAWCVILLLFSNTFQY